MIEAVPSIRNKILAARKAPEEVAQLIATQTEQLTVPVYKRPPDGVFWRVRSDGEWDPQASEVLLLPRKDGGGGPEFLLVLPELGAAFSKRPQTSQLGPLPLSWRSSSMPAGVLAGGRFPPARRTTGTCRPAPRCGV